MNAAPSQASIQGRTAWARNVQTPLRLFLRTETGGGALLLAAAVAALVWVNVDAHSYDWLWSTRLSIDLGSGGVSLTLREWVNSGLMTFFFFGVGLEARREFDLGELRDRQRFALPLAAALGGIAGAVAIYLAFNAGKASAHGWGVAMSTDTAFALGMLALVGPRFPDRLRAFMLTVAVADDVAALIVIVAVYSATLRWIALAVAVLFYVVVLVCVLFRLQVGLVYFLLGIGAWVGLLKAGVEPVVIGLAMGVAAYAYAAPRSSLESATERFREFREQPTAVLARSASAQVRLATSPNERLQALFHPWTSYVIVPVFALANAGIVVNGTFLDRAVHSPITLGIFVGYVVGKPVGVVGGTWIASKLSHGRVRPPVGWAAVAGGGTIAGIGFTVSILIATLAFNGPELEEAKLGVLTAAAGASLVTWLLFRATASLPHPLRIRWLLGTSEAPTDLYSDVDPERDHIRGPRESPVTVVEYGDFECPYCGQAEPIVRELLSDFTEVRYVWRHLPLNDVHPHAQLAAEGAEAASDQGKFWEMHDLLLDHQGALEVGDLSAYAEQRGLDVEQFERDLREHAGAGRVAEDVDSADLSGVTGTPTFFINGRHHYGAYDISTLIEAVRAAGARATIATT